MDTNINFKDLWQKQTSSQPGIEDLLLKLKKFKRANVRKIIITNVLLLTTCGIIIFIWYYFQPRLLTTKLGIVLTILAMVIFLFSYNKLFSIYSRIDQDQTNNNYLENLIEIKTKQKFIQTTMMSLYFILLSLGICLYMIEYTSLMPLFWRIFSYVIFIVWIAFNWFYIRPRTIKKQMSKVDELIDKFKAINIQLKES